MLQDTIFMMGIEYRKMYVSLTGRAGDGVPSQAWWLGIKLTL